MKLEIHYYFHPFGVGRRQDYSPTSFLNWLSFQERAGVLLTPVCKDSPTAFAVVRTLMMANS